MKTVSFLSLRRGRDWGLALGILLASWCLWPSQSAAAQPPSTADQPAIVAVRLEGEEVVVVVQTPPGLTKLTLEARTRLGQGAWVPKLVSRLDGLGGEVTFRLPKSTGLEVLRVRGDHGDPLPSFFYQGSKSFQGAPSSSPGSSMIFRGDTALGPGTPESNTSTGGGTTREVKESDIWEIRGHTLYFFNQYRGLQVIDLTDPVAPVVRGSLNLPAAGERLYVLDDQYVALLARNGCNWWGNQEAESQILIVKVVNGVPEIVQRLGVKGDITGQESRMVGTALYVTSQTFRPITQGGQTVNWEYGIQVSSFDLADPTTPVARGTLWYPGYSQVVMATDRRLFVAPMSPNGGNKSMIYVADISAPDGTMAPVAPISPAGYVKDKFKMQLKDDIFTVISEVWSERSRLITRLETFSIADPQAPVKLGELELAAGEQLHATRFDGDRVYIVTFFRIDPLWIVDLSNPARPTIVGELHVPGWSTYIQPLGKRLVAIGIDDSNSWRVAVSLFNVENPAEPSLMSKVALGDHWSWSEATTDEKAFSVLPQAGLILVPYQGEMKDGFASRVQLIDLLMNDQPDDHLVARGTIDHQFQPRRATAFQQAILSVSGKELLSVDAADRDHPVVKANLDLAWSVNRAFVRGDYLLQITDGDTWTGTTKAMVRVSAALNPTEILSSLTLPRSLPVVGATLRENQLYLAQSTPMGWSYLEEVPPGQEPPVKPQAELVLSTLNLDQLPQLTVAGSVTINVGEQGVSGLQAIWPKPGVLVWAGGSGGYYWWGGPWRLGVTDMMWRPWYGGSGGGRYLAFDVSQADTPKFLSDVNLGNQQQLSWWNFSSSFTENGLVFVSHQTSEFLEGVKGPYAPDPISKWDPTTGRWVTEPSPPGTWVTRYYLNVIDYADPANPTVRKPVNIPGTLQGLSHHATMLYTSGQHWNNDWTTDGAEWLDACAYDGVSAFLVSSMPLPNTWPRPLQMRDGLIFLGRVGQTTGQQDSLETWKLEDSGKFALQGAWFQDEPISEMAFFGNLLVALDSNGVYRQFDATDPTKLQPLAQSRIYGCLSGDLSKAAGDLARGFWLPLADYGIEFMSRSSR